MKTIQKILLIWLIMIPAAIRAQEANKSFYLDLKTGFSFPLNFDTGVLLGSDLNMVRDHRIYTLGYTLMQEFTIWEPEHYTTNQLGLLTGKYFGNQFSGKYIRAGLGPVWGDRLISTGHESYFTAGLFLNAGFRFILFPFTGMGLDADLNLNTKNPVFLLTIGLSLGKIRPPVEQHF